MAESDIPEGMDAGVWASLSPEQRLAYTNPGGAAGVDYQAQAEEQKAAVIKEVKKQMWYSIIFATISSVFMGIFGKLFGGGDSGDT